MKLTVPLKDLQKAEKHIAELKTRERKLLEAAYQNFPIEVYNPGSEQVELEDFEEWCEEIRQIAEDIE